MVSMKKIAILAALVGMSGLLFACGLSPVDQGQSVNLGPNEGVAAIAIDSLDVLSQISFDPVDNGGKPLSIMNAPKGVTLYVFVVPAGTYCEAMFHFGKWAFHARDPKHGTCFDVLPGKIAYSGNIAPRAVSARDIRTYQNYDWQGFEAMLKQQYPDIAAKYPLVTP